jgi:hypothetical protein
LPGDSILDFGKNLSYSTFGGIGSLPKADSPDRFRPFNLQEITAGGDEVKENATKNDGKEASNNMLQIQPSVLELLLRSDKVPDQFSSQQLQEWIIQFDVFVKHPSVAGLDHQQKM